MRRVGKNRNSKTRTPGGPGTPTATNSATRSTAGVAADGGLLALDGDATFVRPGSVTPSVPCVVKLAANLGPPWQPVAGGAEL